MSSKNRVFSHSNDNNFNDYIKNKRGLAIIQNIKSKIGNNTIKYFFNYNDFIILTKVYYKHLSKTNNHHISVPTNMLSTNTSFLVYDQVQAHLNTCRFCNSSTDLFNLCETKCDNLLGILYPYGNYISTNSNNSNNVSKNIYFPSKIDLNNWCSEKCSNEYVLPEPVIKKYDDISVSGCDCSKYNGKRNALFI